MKKALVALLLLVPVFAGAQKTTPNPASYPITVHVQASRLVNECFTGDSWWLALRERAVVTEADRTRCALFQHLTVVIEGKKLELADETPRADLLRIGDYKAGIINQESQRSYEYQRTYEFLFPDGKARNYHVVAESE
jgi:hypothetical protein